MAALPPVQVIVPDAKQGTVVHPCFTGAIYHVVPIVYDDRQLGRIVLGPFVPAELKDPPESLLNGLLLLQDQIAHFRRTGRRASSP